MMLEPRKDFIFANQLVIKRDALILAINEYLGGAPNEKIIKILKNGVFVWRYQKLYLLVLSTFTLNDVNKLTNIDFYILNNKIYTLNEINYSKYIDDSYMME